MHNYIGELLFEEQMTVTELAKRAGLSRSLVSQLVNSDDIPDKTRFDVLEKIANVFHVPITCLFDPLEVIDHEFINVIKQTEVVTKRTIENKPQKSFVELGFIKLKIKNNYELNLSFSSSSNGYVRFEIFSKDDDYYIHLKHIKEKLTQLGFTNLDLKNDGVILYYLTNRSLHIALMYISKTKEFKELVSHIQEKNSYFKDHEKEISVTINTSNNINLYSSNESGIEDNKNMYSLEYVLAKIIPDNDSFL